MKPLCSLINRPKHLLAASLAAGFLVLAAAPVLATGPLYRTTYVSKVSNKLGRGLGNMLFCWAEIPLEVNQNIQNTAPVPGTVSGLGEGFWYTGQRFVLGLVDVVTCPVDVYGNNFQSVQRTEFPFIDEVE